MQVIRIVEISLFSLAMSKVPVKNALFDSSASSYDDEFTHSNIGSLQRKRVYYWLNQLEFFSRPKKIFEINCGTGFDAEKFHQKGHQVLATDISEGMINYAKTYRNHSIQFKTQSFHEVAQNDEVSEYDVLFSNFGGLNCLNQQELKNFMNAISLKQKKGNQLVFVLMSKKCWVESLYFFLKGKFSLINRRNTDEGVEVTIKDEKVKTYYYLPKEVEKMISANYKIQLVKPIACFLPPSYMEPFFKKNKTLLSILNGLEQIFGRFTRMASGADHYIIVAEKQ